MSLFVDIEKRLGSFRLKTELSAADETLALLGASGCGKSMTLKCIAGIEKPDRGKIVVDGVTLYDSERGINLSPQEHRAGLIFQNYALFPNMTVLENIRAGARREKNPAAREKSITGIIDSFGLANLTGHYPAMLSGGQQQRVALARILVSQPRILLLDEPFSALDSHLRFRMEEELRQVIRHFGRTVILVSHNRKEVFRLSDRIAIMNNGQVEAIGPRHTVFEDPKTRTGALLTGCKNISRIRKVNDHLIEALDWGIKLVVANKVTDESFAGIRTHEIQAAGEENKFRCKVVKEVENPFSCTVLLRPEGKAPAEPIGWEMDKGTWNRIRAEHIEISLPPGSVMLLKG